MGKLGPHTRDAFFAWLMPKAKDASYWLLRCIEWPEVPVEADSSLFKPFLVALPAHSTLGNVAHLILEYAFRRGWNVRIEKLLTDASKRALAELKQKVYCEVVESEPAAEDADEVEAEPEVVAYA